MNRAQKRAMKAIIKKKVPKEDREKVLDAVDSLDLEEIMGNPENIGMLLKDPSKLSDFVKGDKRESKEGESTESSVSEAEDGVEDTAEADDDAGADASSSDE